MFVAQTHVHMLIDSTDITDNDIRHVVCFTIFYYEQIIYCSKPTVKPAIIIYYFMACRL